MYANSQARSTTSKHMLLKQSIKYWHFLIINIFLIIDPLCIISFIISHHGYSSYFSLFQYAWILSWYFIYWQIPDHSRGCHCPLLLPYAYNSCTWAVLENWNWTKLAVSLFVKREMWREVWLLCKVSDSRITWEIDVLSQELDVILQSSEQPFG